MQVYNKTMLFGFLNQLGNAYSNRGSAEVISVQYKEKTIALRLVGEVCEKERTLKQLGAIILQIFPHLCKVPGGKIPLSEKSVTKDGGSAAAAVNRACGWVVFDIAPSLRPLFVPRRKS